MKVSRGTISRVVRRPPTSSIAQPSIQQTNNELLNDEKDVPSDSGFGGSESSPGDTLLMFAPNLPQCPIVAPGPLLATTDSACCALKTRGFRLLSIT